LRNPAEAQAGWLRRHLARHATAAYPRACGLRGVHTYAEFADRVPIAGYADVEPWIRRVQRGEMNVLVNEPVTRLVPTSGSTGARKLIPFTGTLQREFNAAIGPWLVDLTRAMPSIMLGTSYWSVTPMGENDDVTDSSVPIGFEDDTEYLGGSRAWLIEGAMAVPSSVRHLHDVESFRRTVLLHLLQAADLRLISIWHPSFLSLLLETLTEDWDALLEQVWTTNRWRARQLSSANPTQPAAIWPRLLLVSCWADAHATGAAEQLKRRLPGVDLQPKGLLATEGCVTLPFSGGHPIAVCSHFFEFIDEHGAVHPVDDLRPGTTYEVVLTTGGGLWRYRLGDRVLVTGVIERTPTLRFVARNGNVSDRCGEKLAEAFVAGVLRALCPAAPFAMLAPERERGGGWRYVLYLEQRDAEPVGPAIRQLDTALSENPHYALCRRLGQLGAPRIVRVDASAYRRFTAAERSRGLRLGDIKPVALSQRTDWFAHFETDPAVANAQ
jgi:hypothetical protein